MRKVHQNNILDGIDVGDKQSRKNSKFFDNRINVIEDVIKKGVKKPLIVNSQYQLDDGTHRLLTLQELSYNSVIIRVL